MKRVYVYDPTASDLQSAVRGVGRYLQILKENFPVWTFTNNLIMKQSDNKAIFINPFYNFLQKPVTLKRIANKQIAVIHDLIPLKYPAHFPIGIKGTIYILLNKLALKNYDLIITDSEASKSDIIKILKIDSEKVKVIYPCLPTIFLQNQKSKIKYQNDNLKIKDFVLYVGDVTWNKNLVNLAKAIKIANVTCIFVGAIFKSPVPNINHPWMSEFKQFLNETKDDPRFILKGFVKDYELIKLYQQATVNILPSRDEGFGFSYLEASVSDCPSLLSNISVLKEISNGNALFFDPENPADIAEKIKRIYSDRNLRQKLITHAKKRSLFFSGKKFKKSFSS